jgi:hypothetical protein
MAHPPHKTQMLPSAACIFLYSVQFVYGTGNVLYLWLECAVVTSTRREMKLPHSEMEHPVLQYKVTDVSENLAGYSKFAMSDDRGAVRVQSGSNMTGTICV